MKSSILTIAWREYWSRVGRISFWISTLSFPLLMGIIFIISAAGGQAVENIETVDLEGIDKPIAIQDRSGQLRFSELNLPELITIAAPEAEKQTYVDLVGKGTLDAFIFYPETLLSEKQIEIYTQDRGFIGNNKYDDLAESLIRTSALKSLQDPSVATALEGRFDTEVSAYKDGQLVSSSPWVIVAPIASLVIYMVLVMTGSQFMLQSVAEEKENRMIEIVLAAVRPSQLILGKLFGLSGVVLTQAASLLLSGAIPLAIISTVAFLALPFDWSELGLSIPQLFLALFGIVVGFITMSALMIGVAAITPNYRDAQSFSGMFVFLAVTPSMFFALLLADPHGLIPTLMTYMPLAGSLTLVLRNSMGAISGWEVVLGVVVNTIYMLISLFAAFRLFEIGALQFNERLNFTQIRRTLFK